jgi:hypothetical protein
VGIEFEDPTLVHYLTVLIVVFRFAETDAFSRDTFPMCECSKLFPLDSAIISFCFLFLFSLVRLMENNNKIRELYSIYLELGHEVFEEKI